MPGTVLQSGAVTPNHLAIFATDGVIADGGVAPANVIASLRQANFNVITDQPIIIPANISVFCLTSIIVTNSAVSMTSAAGGFYTAAQKQGSLIVASSQRYTALSSLTALMNPALTAFGSGTRFSASNLPFIGTQLAIYFSLTVPQGVSAQADIYLVGSNLS